MSRRKRESKEQVAAARSDSKFLSAKLRYLRVAPRKVRLVVNNIRGKQVEEALGILDFTERAVAKPLARMLRAAVANAASAESVDVDRLIVEEVWVDQGPVLKRFLPRAMGRATKILKKSSHVTLRLAEKD